MTSTANGEVLLIAFPWADGAAAAPLRAEFGAALRLYRSLDGAEGYAYLWGAGPGTAPRHRPAGARVVRLACTLDVPGAAAGADAPYHYVVETDVEPAMAEELDAWYDTEHLPGLAAVPGTVRARRLRNPAPAPGSPQHHACYDLATLEAFNSPPWLAVRATPWSSRVRPAFRNTKRTMFARVD